MSIIYYCSGHADVAELADALDSGSSGHCARAGSSPVIRIQEAIDFIGSLSFFSSGHCLSEG